MSCYFCSTSVTEWRGLLKKLLTNNKNKPTSVSSNWVEALPNDTAVLATMAIFGINTETHKMNLVHDLFFYCRFLLYRPIIAEITPGKDGPTQDTWGLSPNQASQHWSNNTTCPLGRKVYKQTGFSYSATKCLAIKTNANNIDTIILTIYPPQSIQWAAKYSHDPDNDGTSLFLSTS